MEHGTTRQRRPRAKRVRPGSRSPTVPPYTLGNVDHSREKNSPANNCRMHGKGFADPVTARRKKGCPSCGDEGWTAHHAGPLFLEKLFGSALFHAKAECKSIAHIGCTSVSHRLSHWGELATPNCSLCIDVSRARPPLNPSNRSARSYCASKNATRSRNSWVVSMSGRPSGMIDVFSGWRSAMFAGLSVNSLPVESA